MRWSLNWVILRVGIGKSFGCNYEVRRTIILPCGSYRIEDAFQLYKHHVPLFGKRIDVSEPSLMETVR